MQVPEKLYGILGTPLGHSLSPALHSWGFALSGHAGAYFAWEKEKDELPAFFFALRCLPIAGLSVTIPHKEAAGLFVDELDTRARTVGAVNTLYWRNGRLRGENTDVAGFLAPLAGLARKLPPAALVLGAGGACRAVLSGLNELGLRRVVVACRNPEKGAALAAEFPCVPIAWEKRIKALAALGPALVVNATPLGLRGHREKESPLPETALADLARSSGREAAPLVYDLVYTPLQTRLLLAARRHGLDAVSGLDFFVAQGLAQFQLWTGISLPFSAARAYILETLAV
jgi:shikimate dehydrogenase